MGGVSNGVIMFWVANDVEMLVEERSKNVKNKGSSSNKGDV